MTLGQEIKRRITETRKEMRLKGIRKISCFNGGLSRDESYYNKLLFKLGCDLDSAKQLEEMNQSITRMSKAYGDA